MHAEAHEPCRRLLTVVAFQAVQLEIDVLTVTTRIHSASQGAFNRHVLGEGRQETRDVVRGQGIRLPGELQRGQGQAQQAQATAAPPLGRRPGQET
jgi:hypothetical protein